MTEHVVTLMWGDAWERYGRAFASSFVRHWPKHVKLTVVTDKRLPIDRARQIPLHEVPGYGAFIARWKDDRRANGFDHDVRKVDAQGRSWRHDAVKWAPQGLAPRAALDGLDDGDLLAWFDADVETHARPPTGWLERLVGRDDLACLQRPGRASEIGFWAIRVSPETRRMVEMFAAFYSSGAVFKLPEWHSGYAFDRAVEACPALKVRNLNSRDARGHCWPQTPLAEFTVHKKGKRKGC